MSVRGKTGKPSHDTNVVRENQSYFSIASHADVLRGSSRVPVSGAGTQTPKEANFSTDGLQHEFIRETKFTKIDWLISYV